MKAKMIKSKCRKCDRNFHAKNKSDMDTSKLCAGCHRKREVINES